MSASLSAATDLRHPWGDFGLFTGAADPAPWRGLVAHLAIARPLG